MKVGDRARECMKLQRDERLGVRADGPQRCARREEGVQPAGVAPDEQHGTVFGGRFIPETLMVAHKELEEAWNKWKVDPGFKAELATLRRENEELKRKLTEHSEPPDVQDLKVRTGRTRILQYDIIL